MLRSLLHLYLLYHGDYLGSTMDALRVDRLVIALDYIVSYAPYYAEVAGGIRYHKLLDRDDSMRVIHHGVLDVSVTLVTACGVIVIAVYGFCPYRTLCGIVRLGSVRGDIAALAHVSPLLARSNYIATVSTIQDVVRLVPG